MAVKYLLTITADQVRLVTAGPAVTEMECLVPQTHPSGPATSGLRLELGDKLTGNYMGVSEYNVTDRIVWTPSPPVLTRAITTTRLTKTRLGVRVASSLQCGVKPAQSVDNTRESKTALVVQTVCTNIETKSNPFTYRMKEGNVLFNDTLNTFNF